MPARKVEPSAIEKRQFGDELPAGGDGTPPLHRCGQVSSIVRFVLMPDGHLLSAEQKVGKDSPKRTKVLLENTPFGGMAIPPERPPSTGALPPKRFKKWRVCGEGVGAVRM